MLVIDIGTSSVRAAVVRTDATFAYERAQELLPDHPADGLVEFDARAMADAALTMARAALDAAGPVDAVGISNQRASAVVWDRKTGEPVGPGLGWQDLRTVGDCLALRAENMRLAPNQSATKVKWLLDQFDPERDRNLCFGTVDTWIVWNLTAGRTHVTDASNAAVTGLVRGDHTEWDPDVAAALGIPATMLPEIIDSTGIVTDAVALPGAPPIAGVLGDQQAALVGQGCVHHGDAKITFGTGAMLDLTLDQAAPKHAVRNPHGTFPIVAWREGGRPTYGIEAIMLAAGTNVQWLRDAVGLIDSAAASHDVASTVEDADGVVFVPAMLGLGTPRWDYGARSALLGLTRGSTRAHVVRAVLEGIAQRGADLVEAAEEDAGLAIPALRVDGGMSDNPTYVQALADASQRPVEISPIREATALGAALMAGLAVGHHSSVADLARTWQPRARIEPQRVLDRARWRDAVTRASGWIPALSNVDF
ncbi:MAG: FGGY family carbohydrate kinase [Acidimicrobiia bacterium]